MAISHEEADVVIINQVLPLAKYVLRDNTKVFAFLVHFYYADNITADMFMIPTNRTRVAINRGATVHKHKDITPHILSLHALTSCGIVSSIFGIGKIKALETLNWGCMPPNFGNPQVDSQGISEETTYRKTSNIRRTSIGNKILDHSDVVGASPVGAAPTTSSFSN